MPRIRSNNQTSPVLSDCLPHMGGWLIDKARIRLMNLIGRGSFGVVYRAVDVVPPADSRPPRFYAVKCQLRSVEPRVRYHQEREIKLHKLATGHPSVVSLHKVVREHDYVYLVMDYCPDGDLFNLLTDKKSSFEMTNETIKTTFLQLLDGIEHIHQLGITHRDLKPENILCDNGKLLVTDFGLATSDESGYDFLCGSSYYMSPECVGDVWGRIQPFRYRPSDVWALGMILVNLTCRRNPWSLASYRDAHFQQFIRQPNLLRESLPISASLHDVLRRIFTLDPGRRISVQELRTAVSRIRVFRVSDRSSLYRQPSNHEAADTRPTWPPRKKIASPARPKPAPVPALQPLPPQRKYDDVPVLQINFSFDTSSSTLGIYNVSSDFADILAGAGIPGFDDAQQPEPAATLVEDESFIYVPPMVAPSSSEASLSSSDGPITPEMQAVDQTHVTSDLDDDPLDIAQDNDWEEPIPPASVADIAVAVKAQRCKDKKPRTLHRAINKIRRIVA